MWDPSIGIAYERTPTPEYMDAVQELREDSLTTP